MSSVSIIIATLGRSASLEETLRSLSDIRIPETWKVELLLVENGSQSGADKLLCSVLNNRFIGSRYLFEPSRGKSRALNLALKQASGEVLLFTDDDVRIPDDWVERMCQPIFEGMTDAVAGGVRLATHLLRPWMNRTHRAWLASTADYLSPDQPAEMCGANMAVRRQVFEMVGGFDTELGPGITGVGEETLISWQIKKAGFRITSAFHIQVEHHPDSGRLQYHQWIRAAQAKGRTKAYQLHHWLHKGPRHAGLLRHFYSLKLAVRRLSSLRRKPDDEGIAPWELSYVESIAIFSHYRRYQKQPRNYALEGLRKLEVAVPL